MRAPCQAAAVPAPALAACVAMALLGAAAASSECGAKGGSDRGAIDGRIVNGETADACEWKWQVALDAGYFFCGGTLVAPNWVVTAAHCILGGSFNVVAGSWKQNSDDSTQVTLAVKAVHQHPDYDSWTSANDIALLELEDDAPMDDCIGLACLPTEDVNAGEECWITGWGTTSSGGSSPNKMREAQVTAYSNEDCDASYESNGYYGSITDDMLCAQGTNDDGELTDACQGDSGGPLVCVSAGRYVLHGATSWGYGCAAPGLYGVWSRVYYFRDWIDGLMGEDAPAACADDHSQMIALASSAGYSISGCSDAEPFCEHATYGSTVQATCPATCTKDDDAQMIALASGAGVTIDGCADTLAYCEHSVYGSTVQATCPATCGSCTGSDRRLADGKAPNAEKTEESSNSDTKFLYP